MGLLETLRDEFDILRIGLRMCHTLVQAMTARLIGGSMFDEFNDPVMIVVSLRVLVVRNMCVFFKQTCL